MPSTKENAALSLPVCIGVWCGDEPPWGGQGKGNHEWEETGKQWHSLFTLSVKSL